MIALSSSSTVYGFEYNTKKLMQRMLNPLCGLVQEIGFLKNNKFGSRILSAGADITGVHVLLNTENPGRGAYHTGGSGIYLNEPIIKSLGETVERYAQLTAALNMKSEFIFATYNEMHKKYENVLQREYLDVFTEEQFNFNGFPFQRFDEYLPLSWVKVSAINQKKFFWIPAQLLFVGYQVNKNLGEPWYSTAVTTGTAAHTNKLSVLLNSILEIIQVDSAIGHWYSNYEIPEIVFDERTQPMENILKKYDSFGRDAIQFYWLKNPDLAGICVACILEKPENTVPRISIGLGASVSLNDALYKAYLEAIGVSTLGNVLVLKDKLYYS